MLVHRAPPDLTCDIDMRREQAHLKNVSKMEAKKMTPPKLVNPSD